MNNTFLLLLFLVLIFSGLSSIIGWAYCNLVISRTNKEAIVLLKKIMRMSVSSAASGDRDASLLCIEIDLMIKKLSRGWDEFATEPIDRKEA